MRHLLTTLLAVTGLLVAILTAHGAEYYASPTGSDASSGNSPAAAWRSLRPLDGKNLQPGDKVLLQAGGVYKGPFKLIGSGSADKPILLSSYGKGVRPIVTGVDTVNDCAITIENGSWWTVRGLSLRHAKIGVYLRYYNSYGHTGMVVEQCDFADMPDRTADPLKHNYELAWTCGVFIGGSANHTDTVLDGVTVRNCRFTRIYGVGVYSAWYWPKPNPNRVRHFKYENSVADGCFGGAFGTIDMADSELYRVHSFRSGGTTQWGTAAGMIQSTANISFRECIFSGTRRNGCPDGGGLDIEGSSENISFDHCLFYGNDGCGLMHLTTGGLNKNINVRSCSFFNNAISPTNAHDAAEINCSDPRNEALYENCGFYPRPNRKAFSDMSEMQKADPAQNRFGQWSDLVGRKSWWEDAKLTSGIWIQPSWFVITEPSYLWIRYRQKQPAAGRFLFLTDTDSKWNPQHGVALPPATGGVVDKLYRIDTLTPLAVLAQLKVEFPQGSGTELQFVRLTHNNDRQQMAPVVPAPLPVSLTVPGVAGRDGASSEVVAIGDTGQNTQTTMLLSFDTSVLPKQAKLVGAILKLTRTGVMGSVEKPWEGPWSWRELWGNRMVVDIKRGEFGNTPGALAPADMLQGAAFSILYADGLQGWASLEPRGLGYVNREGLTQLRVRFQMPTNGNGRSEYASFAAVGNQKPEWRPVLELLYQPGQ